jgi:hypothetical protein
VSSAALTGAGGVATAASTGAGLLAAKWIAAIGIVAAVGGGSVVVAQKGTAPATTEVAAMPPARGAAQSVTATPSVGASAAAAAQPDAPAPDATGETTTAPPNMAAPTAQPGTAAPDLTTAGEAHATRQSVPARPARERVHSTHEAQPAANAPGAETTAANAPGAETTATTAANAPGAETTATTAANAPGAETAATAAPVASTLGAEVSSLDSARNALRAGEPARALRELDAFDAKHPNSALGEDAAVLRFDAYVALGDRAGADRAARAFLARYPTSPRAAKVRRWLESANGSVAPIH